MKFDKAIATNKREHFTTNARFSVQKSKKTFGQGENAVVTEQATLRGYAITFDTLSDDRGGYRVRLSKNSGVPVDGEVIATYHHNYAETLGTTENGSLRILPADDVGIPVEIDLPRTTYADNVLALVEDSYCRGMSFTMTKGFEDYDEDEDEDGVPIIDVKRFHFDEVCVTPIPAFDSTSIGVAEDDDEDAEDEKMDDGEGDTTTYDETDSEMASKAHPARLAAQQRLSVAKLAHASTVAEITHTGK